MCIRDRIKAVNEQVHEDINKTQELEATTMTLETALVEPNKTTKEYSSEINTLKKNQRGKVERLKTELKRGATQMMVYPTQSDERTKLFKTVRRILLMIIVYKTYRPECIFTLILTLFQKQPSNEFLNCLLAVKLYRALVYLSLIHI